MTFNFGNLVIKEADKILPPAPQSSPVAVAKRSQKVSEHLLYTKTATLIYAKQKLVK